METKPIKVTYAVYLQYFLSNVIPAIKMKWPRNHEAGIRICIQHDNAPSHFSHDEPSWRRLVESDNNWRFELREQPPNSPDTNVLDLGFFAMIQSMQWGQAPATTIDGLIASVVAAWDWYDPKVLDRIWLTHQSCMNEIMSSGGGNHYKLPHLGKSTLVDVVGQIPRSIAVSRDAEIELEDLELFDLVVVEETNSVFPYH
jgi:hypothetical protein